MMSRPSHLFVLTDRRLATPLARIAHAPNRAATARERGIRHQSLPYGRGSDDTLSRKPKGRAQFGLLILMVFAAAVALNPAIGAEEKAAAKEPAWKSLFDGKTLKNWKASQFGGEGDVSVEDGVIVMTQGSDITGITWTGEQLPKMNYEVSLMAKRIEGNDFFCGLTFEVNDDPCSLIIGGWGGGVVGISSLNGLDASTNETARYESFEKDEWYKIRMRVSEIGMMAWIDDKQVVSVETKGKKISIRGEVEASRPFGVSCYRTTAGLKEIKVRSLSMEEAKAPLTRAADNRLPASKKKKADAN